MSTKIKKLLGEEYFYFFDAAAPIVEKDSIDFNIAYYKSRYDKGENEYIKELIDIPRMSEMCSKMLEALNEAFLNEDDELAYQIALTDRELDKLYSKIREDSLKVMYRDPESNISQGVRLLFIGRYLERIGDHITNICEKIIYAKKGTMVEIG